VAHLHAVTVVAYLFGGGKGVEEDKMCVVFEGAETERKKTRFSRENNEGGQMEQTKVSPLQSHTKKKKSVVPHHSPVPLDEHELLEVHDPLLPQALNEPIPLSLVRRVFGGRRNQGEKGEIRFNANHF
jgi:hypothetical protein